MAHFAKLDDNNIVTNVIKVSDKDITLDRVEVESIGVSICRELFNEPDSKWKQCSINEKFRGCYPGIGFHYSEEKDIFIEPKCHESWILNEKTGRWEAPIPCPYELTKEDEDNHLSWVWAEYLHQIDNSKGWVLLTPPIKDGDNFIKGYSTSLP